MKKNLLELQNLGIGYKKSSQKTWIQSHLNMSIHEGELICLIGPNGSGKSTLLKTLGRILPPLQGDMIIDGKDISHISNHDFSRKVGLVLTEQMDVPHLRAADIISMGRYPYVGFWGQLKKEDWDIVQEVSDVVGLTHLLERPFSELSDGEKQKVMIAKVLAQKTPLMLLDEPTAFLDFPTKSSLLIMLRKLAREHHISVILSTHDIELALKIADQIWMFPQHQKVISGAPEDLVLQGDILNVFKNNDISFDIKSGHFEKVFNPVRKMNVTGKDPHAFWLKKALLRNEIENSEDSKWVIDCQEKFRIFHDQKFLNEANSIEEVLKYLKIQ